MLPSSGPLSISAINVEKGLASNTSNSSLTTLSTININSNSPQRPNGIAPHAISEFYGYDQTIGGSQFDRTYVDNDFVTSIVDSRNTAGTSTTTATDAASIQNTLDAQPTSGVFGFGVLRNTITKNGSNIVNTATCDIRVSPNGTDGGLQTLRTITITAPASTANNTEIYEPFAVRILNTSLPANLQAGSKIVYRPSATATITSGVSTTTDAQIYVAEATTFPIAWSTNLRTANGWTGTTLQTTANTNTIEQFAETSSSLMSGPVVALGANNSAAENRYFLPIRYELSVGGSGAGTKGGFGQIRIFGSTAGDVEGSYVQLGTVSLSPVVVPGTNRYATVAEFVASGPLTHIRLQAYTAVTCTPFDETFGSANSTFSLVLTSATAVSGQEFSTYPVCWVN